MTATPAQREVLARLARQAHLDQLAKRIADGDDQADRRGGDQAQPIKEEE